MDFIVAPFVVGIIFYFTYMTFELFARKEERMKLIDKIGQNLAPSDSSGLSIEFGSLLAFKKKSFISLRFGCLFVGIGLGLLVGLLLCLWIRTGLQLSDSGWQNRNFYNVAYGSSVLLFGGLGLLVSYFIETKSAKKEENNSH